MNKNIYCIILVCEPSHVNADSKLAIVSFYGSKGIIRLIRWLWSMLSAVLCLIYGHLYVKENFNHVFIEVNLQFQKLT